MKNFFLLLASLSLALLLLSGVELELEERQELEEAGIELAEQLDEAREIKAKLSKELRHLNEEGEQWEAGNIELKLHNAELDVVMMEKLLKRHDVLLKASQGDDAESFEQKIADFHRSHVDTEMRRELNELTLNSKQLRREIGHLTEEQEHGEVRRLEKDLAVVIKALNGQEELIAHWAKTTAVGEAGNEEAAERLEQEFWIQREAIDSERERSYLERELVRIEQQQVDLKKEAEWLEKRKAILSRTLGSHRKLAEVRKQVLRAHKDHDEASVEELEETLERLTERFHVENELRHLRLELHFAERERGAEEEVAELREAIRELNEEWERLQD